MIAEAEQALAVPQPQLEAPVQLQEAQNPKQKSEEAQNPKGKSEQEKLQSERKVMRAQVPELRFVEVVIYWTKHLVGLKPKVGESKGKQA